MTEKKQLRNDPYLLPYEKTIQARMRLVEEMRNRLTQGGQISLGDFASGHEFFGLHFLENQADSAKVATSRLRQSGYDGRAAGRPGRKSPIVPGMLQRAAIAKQRRTVIIPAVPCLPWFFLLFRKIPGREKPNDNGRNDSVCHDGAGVQGGLCGKTGIKTG